ncbi:DEAD/DEAH box helicase [Desulfovibrio sp. 86]|uniref:RNA helicase n=1 Tax=uncultured Desulfovibrio sp. TaxID=167968 RepID=A0A212L737_9BACT|nr:DEAD/DEAH box helicase [Desulfovibrio sp. 86]SCM73371.1 DEAD/DEAH box helicase domain protein [uncultured Desulfovibrio sp.]VZH34154.1 DEAD/DEAH box helicase domain protein [Desulfovibrio sp. 86]
MPEHQLPTDPDTASATAKDAPSDVAAAPLEGISVSEPEDALPRVTLDDLPQVMREACARAGWQGLMPVQSLAFPYLLEGRDIMVQSRTGSGKTGCYLLPMLPRLSADLKASQALVLAPTRELAVQVEREAATLFEGTGIVTVAVYGGVGYKKQMDALRDGAQLIVGTPGRVLDHLLRRTLDLKDLRELVFDEADRMLSIGFYPDMKEIQRYLPRRPIHTCLFSATYPPHVLKLAGEFMAAPAMLSLSQKEVHVAEVQHLFCEVKPMDKDRALVRLLETENPASAIIFCNTKANVHYVTGVLQGFGYSADELSADLSQSRREAVLEKIRQGKLQYLVATDVAARGIDIPELSHVFLYEPPEDHESYIHRAGRTGRAGAAGTVISLVDVMQRMELDRIAKHYKIGLIPLPLPTDEDVARVAGARLTAILEGRFRNLTGLERMRVARYTQLARDLASEGGDDEDSALLLAMLLDSAHQESLRENRFPDPSSPSSAGQNGGSRHGSGRGGSGSRGGRSSRGGNVGNSDRSERGDRSDRGERGARSERGETASGESAEARSGRRRRSSRRRDGEQGRDAGDTAPRNEQGKTDSAE